MLANVRHGEVLAFREELLGSLIVGEAVGAMEPQLRQLQTFHSETISEKGKRVSGVGIKKFLGMVQRAKMIGSSLSLMQVKDCFVNSLKISYDGESRRPLLRTEEQFQEAMVRQLEANRPPCVSLKSEPALRVSWKRAGPPRQLEANRASASAGSELDTTPITAPFQPAHMHACSSPRPDPPPSSPSSPGKAPPHFAPR